MDDRYAINVMKTEIREGYNTGDVDRVLSAYLEGFADFSNGFPSTGGQESKIILRQRLDELFFRYRVEFIPIIISINCFAGGAVVYGWHQFRLHSKLDQSTTLLRTRYVEVWEKGADGQWGIAVFIDNADEKPVMLDEMLVALKAGKYDPAAHQD